MLFRSGWNRRIPYLEPLDHTPPDAMGNSDLGTGVVYALVLPIIVWLYLWFLSAFPDLYNVTIYIISDPSAMSSTRQEGQNNDLPGRDEDHATDLPTGFPHLS